MNPPQISPYGSWTSPITSDLIVSETIGLGQIGVEGSDIYWLEQRPQEGGRTVAVRWRGGETIDLTPQPFNVRSRAHEYGGGAFRVDQGILYFVNFADQQLYRQAGQEPPEPLTQTPGLRYADGVVDRQRQRMIWVQEDHRSGEHQVINILVSLPLTGGAAEIVAQGQDFYASPTISPDGEWLAWLSWNQPQMPWDGTELWVARLQVDGSLANVQRVAGSPTESVFQPRWSAEGWLYFVSDASDWWNLYRWHPSQPQVQPLYPRAAEFGLPQWVFGMSTYGLQDDQSLFCAYNHQNLWQLGRLDLARGEFTNIPTPYTDISSLQVTPEAIVFLGGSATQPTAIVRCDLATHELQVLRSSTALQLDPGYLSQPQPIAFPTSNGATAHAFFYPPQNKDYLAPAGELPPLIVKSHGGPTAASSTVFNLSIQYWTSRGFALVDVNYRGSTGYGRAYRQSLQGQWGIVDVADCVQAAEYLVAQGWVDGDRLIIRGSSAGGYTTLAALTFTDRFKAGASYYGVSDLEALARDTHKFEARYLDGLIAPYPQEQAIYQQRSPLHFIDQLNCPVIFFQGLEDKVVPPNQAEVMVNALAAKGIPVAYVPFAEEQHGFRRAENIKAALDGELYFYAQIFGLSQGNSIVPILIKNLN